MIERAYQLIILGKPLSFIKKETGLSIDEINIIAMGKGRHIISKNIFHSKDKYPLDEPEDKILYQPPSYEELTKDMPGVIMEFEKKKFNKLSLT